MIEQYTAELFRAFGYGAAGVLGGGLLFQGGKRYAKTAGSHQFKGKIEALPFFFGTLVFGWILQHLDPYVNSLVYSIPAIARAGIVIIGTMVMFNYSIDYFTYDDPKSLGVYAIGILLLCWPYM